MTLLLSLAVAVLFGSGAYLLLKPDLVRVVVGVVLISNAANLFIMAAGLTKGSAPIWPLPAGETISDPLVQAMTLTAIVITFGVSALLLSIVYRVYTSHLSLDLDDLAAAEEREAAAEEMASPPATSDDPDSPDGEWPELTEEPAMAGATAGRSDE
jgi:multicomponent Na+:H+ antiporter subunit C